MGAVLGRCRRGSKKADEACDGVTELSKTDIKAIRTLWEEMRRKDQLIPMAAELFVSLIEDYPYIEEYFKGFEFKRGSNVEGKLAKHALTFVSGFQLYIDYIDAPEVLVGILKQVALEHLNRDISIQEMELLFDQFEKAMCATVKTKFTEQHKISWAKFFKFLNFVFRSTEIQINGIVTHRRQKDEKPSRGQLPNIDNRTEKRSFTTYASNNNDRRSEQKSFTLRVSNIAEKSVTTGTGSNIDLRSTDNRSQLSKASGPKRKS